MRLSKLFLVLIFVFIISQTIHLVIAEETNHTNVYISVIDARDKPVPDAIVKLDCPSQITNQLYYTDRMGDVYIKNKLSEECLLRVAFENYFYKEIISLKGPEIHQEIKFDKLNKKNYTLTIILILILLIMLVIIITFKKKIKEQIQKVGRVKELGRLKDAGGVNEISDVKEEKQTNEINTKKYSVDETIMSVLNDKEKKVINFLKEGLEVKKEQINKFYVSQANISFHTQIPKTSLIRVLNNLKNKGLIEIKRFGKAKRIFLSEKIINKR